MHECLNKSAKNCWKHCWKGRWMIVWLVEELMPYCCHIFAHTTLFLFSCIQIHTYIVLLCIVGQLSDSGDARTVADGFCGVASNTTCIANMPALCRCFYCCCCCFLLSCFFRLRSFCYCCCCGICWRSLLTLVDMSFHRWCWWSLYYGFLTAPHSPLLTVTRHCSLRLTLTLLIPTALNAAYLSPGSQHTKWSIPLLRFRLVVNILLILGFAVVLTMSGRWCFRSVVADVRFGILYAKHSSLCVFVGAYKQCVKVCPSLDLA